MASSAPVSAPSASCSISNFNPLYCPALAKLASESQSFESTADSASSNLSSSPQTPLSASPPKDGEQTPVHHLPPAPTELLPIRDCCRACRRAAAYGERCSDAEYHENWSKAALEKRKRDEETLFERGEYINRKRSQGEIVDEAEMNEPGQREVHDVEVLEKEARHHPIPHHHSPLHSPLHSPSHTQLSSPLHSPSDEVHEDTKQGRISPSAAGPSCVLAQAHAHIVAHHEARQQKAAAHAQEIDDARQRIAKLDVGKMTRREEDDEEADSDSDSARSSPREGEALQLEGVGVGLSTSPKSAKLDLAQSPKSRQKRSEQEENEKNPICTLDGRVLRPCSSRSIYTGGPAIASQANEADRASNASSSDLSDDIVSNLSSLGLSPASATTAASSWFGGEEMQSPPLTRSMKEGSTEHDYFALSAREEEKEEMKEVLAEPVKLTSPSSGSGATGCSPLMRSKACLRPAALYNPSAAEDLMTQSCPTIKEEKSLPPSPGIATMPNNTLQRIHTASSALEKEAELREALKEADKPLFSMPSRTQSLPADAGRSPLRDEGNGGRRPKQSWTSRLLHRGKGLSSLGVAHGIVH